MDQAGNPLTTSGALSWNYDTKAPNITGVIFTGSGTTDTGFTAGYSFGTDEPTSSTLVVNS